MRFASLVMDDIASYLATQKTLSGCDVELAYENEIKPTPLVKPIVSVGLEKLKVSEHIFETAADGSITETNKRTADLTVKICLFAPYSTGSTGCYEIMESIISSLLFSYSAHKFTSFESGNVNFVRDIGALVLENYFTVQAVFAS